MQKEWNERYSSEVYIYGKEPNDYFRQEIDKLSPGRLLLIGEGEGRNGVYAARKGWKVDAVDFSENARAKALKLAEENKVSINYQISDIADYIPAAETYDAVGIIFIHLDPEVREKMHHLVIQALKPGGTLILEIYDKDQINMTSGGPKDPDLLYSLEEIVEDFTELDFVSLTKENIYLNESVLHFGEAWVIRFTVRKAS